MAAYNSCVTHRLIFTNPTGPCDGPLISFPLVGQGGYLYENHTSIGANAVPQLGYRDLNPGIQESKSCVFTA